MAFATSPDQGAPMGDLNTTPLIDVMLVLLVMFIITIPVATHTVEFGLPTPCTNCPTLQPDPVSNKVVIDNRDQLLWNGTPISEGQLSALLVETQQLPVEPELQFEPDQGASYRAAAHTLKTIKASGVTNFGFAGNEKYREL